MSLIKLNLERMELELIDLMKEYCSLRNLELTALYFDTDKDFEDEEDSELYLLIWYSIKDDTCYNATQTKNGELHFISINPKHKAYNLKDDEFYGLFEIMSCSSCDVFDPWEFCNFCVKKTRPNSRIVKSLKEQE